MKPSDEPPPSDGLSLYVSLLLAKIPGSHRLSQSPGDWEPPESERERDRDPPGGELRRLGESRHAGSGLALLYDLRSPQCATQARHTPTIRLSVTRTQARCAWMTPIESDTHVSRCWDGE